MVNETVGYVAVVGLDFDVPDLCNSQRLNFLNGDRE
jgi:hypothetical protein